MRRAACECARQCVCAPACACGPGPSHLPTAASRRQEGGRQPGRRGARGGNVSSKLGLHPVPGPWRDWQLHTQPPRPGQARPGHLAVQPPRGGRGCVWPSEAHRPGLLGAGTAAGPRLRSPVPPPRPGTGTDAGDLGDQRREGGWCHSHPRHTGTHIQSIAPARPEADTLSTHPVRHRTLQTRVPTQPTHSGHTHTHRHTRGLHTQPGDRHAHQAGEVYPRHAPIYTRVTLKGNMYAQRHTARTLPRTHLSH